jgi:glycosyltransferase involved in cell wall biosynthesis
MFNVSIVICCYNSESRIKKTLLHISRQELGGLSAELLIVDNNCNDNTVNEALKCWNSFGAPFPIIIISENKQGVSNSRRAGVLAAQSEVIVFCDDDNWLGSKYITTAYEFIKNRPEFKIVCGLNLPVADDSLPEWFSEYQGWYACGLPQIKKTNNELHTAWTAGMAISTEMIKKLYQNGIQHLTTGRKGSELISGEDDEISFWVSILGGKIGFCDKMLLHHYMPVDRLNIKYRERLISSISTSLEILRPKWWVIKKALEPVRKMDFLYIFLPNSRGLASRLKLNLSFGDSIIKNNTKILKKLRCQS